jgi:signal transduction histidine kinase
MAAGHQGLALFAFIGGLSAATSMVIVASIALAIMISNHLVAPLVLRLPFYGGTKRGSFSKTLLMIRRISIIFILILGFTYYRLTETGNPLASIGLISFAGVAQFLPALIGGIYWRNATKSGATAGLVAGFILWGYTLLAPSMAGAGWAFVEITEKGLFGLILLKPDALFGMTGWDPLVHGLFWSMTVNIGLYVIVSVFSNASPLERLQSALFVDAFRTGEGGMEGALQRSATTDDLMHLTSRILGRERAHEIFRDFARRQGREEPLPLPEPALIAHVERQLAGSIGAASARTLISRVAQGETITLDAVINLLDETQQAIRYSRELERKSRELEGTAAELRRANDQLTRLDKMKDDFLSQVSHELRTPMTSIRSFSEILVSSGDIDEEQSRRFLSVIQHESERLTRLLDEILELSRLENGQLESVPVPTDAVEVMRGAIETMRGLTHGRGVTVHDELGSESVMVLADPDRLKQVCINLLSNAAKFSAGEGAAVWVSGGERDGMAVIDVRDNGPGIPADVRETLFQKFSRGWSANYKTDSGSGLGLAISKRLMLLMKGDLRLTDTGPEGTCFTIHMSASREAQSAAE